MTARPSKRLFDPATADRLGVLLAQAKECTLTVSLDYCPLRPPECSFIVQMFDHSEREILTARGATLAEVVNGLHQRWLAKGLPG